MNCVLTRFVLWLVTLALFPVPVAVLPLSFQIEVLQRITLAALPQERPLHLAERVAVYLEQAEKRETDPWLRDDLRIAWITVNWSQRGVPEWSWHRDSSPYVAATYQVLRCRPDEVWPLIVAQRKANLGAAYEKVWGEAPLSVRVPKKPVRSVRHPARDCVQERQASA